MKKNRISLQGPATLALLTCLFWPAASVHAEVDFSCMKESTLEKIPVTDRYREYDLNIRNECPGAAYWTMCIERMDPHTHRLLETHTPSGWIDEGKKQRVNVHMKPGSDPLKFRNRYQEFYVTVQYSIDTPAKASCVAERCEAASRGIRKDIMANEKAWAQAFHAMQARFRTECPESGWDTKDQDACIEAIRAGDEEQMRSFAIRDEELRLQLEDEASVGCELYGGLPIGQASVSD